MTQLEPSPPLRNLLAFAEAGMSLQGYANVATREQVALMPSTAFIAARPCGARNGADGIFPHWE